MQTQKRRGSSTFQRDANLTELAEWWLAVVDVELPSDRTRPEWTRCRGRLEDVDVVDQHVGQPVGQFTEE